VCAVVQVKGHYGGGGRGRIYGGQGQLHAGGDGHRRSMVSHGRPAGVHAFYEDQYEIGDAPLVSSGNSHSLGGSGRRLVSQSRPAVEAVYDGHHGLQEAYGETPVVEVDVGHDDVLVEQHYGPGEKSLGDMGTFATSGLYTQLIGKPTRLLYRRVKPVSRAQLAAPRRVVLTEEADLDHGYDDLYDQGHDRLVAPRRNVLAKEADLDHGYDDLYSVAERVSVGHGGLGNVYRHGHGSGSRHVVEAEPAYGLEAHYDHGVVGDDVYGSAGQSVPVRRVQHLNGGHGRRVGGHGRRVGGY